MKWLDDWVFIDEEKDGKLGVIILLPFIVGIVALSLYFGFCGFKSIFRWIGLR